jgi:hypothetical protein
VSPLLESVQSIAIRYSRPSVQAQQSRHVKRMKTMFKVDHINASSICNESWLILARNFGIIPFLLCVYTDVNVFLVEPSHRIYVSDNGIMRLRAFVLQNFAYER